MQSYYLRQGKEGNWKFLLSALEIANFEELVAQRFADVLEQFLTIPVHITRG
ncbi:MAG: hypothetical protein JJU34_11665 [Lunatimonas sp.]|uniref:hypothetical protein n=1 Tax=Lunatimonas sp. TaxID=2060141 RepID=UPI00263B8367|nr:hypothetical protein [Lunatimonas sp.]MCC5937928.1 hypothetical protein [Lunatimonas sp.]